MHKPMIQKFCLSRYWLLGSILFLFSLITSPSNAQVCEICDPQTSPFGGSCEELFVTLDVNSSPIQGTHLVIKSNDKFWLPSQIVNALNTQIKPNNKALEVCGREFSSEEIFEGASATFNDATLQLSYNIPAKYFSQNEINNRRLIRFTPSPSELGGTLQYDFAFQSSSDISASSFLDFTAFYGKGHGEANFLARNIVEDTEFVRLITNWQYDFPKSDTSFVIGDSFINTSRAFRGGVLFGGFKYGTNKQLRPGLRFFPNLVINGVAEVPSTIDLIINNQVRESQNIPPGPFDLEPSFSFTGEGEVEVIIRDALGRQQVVTGEFFTDLELLAPKTNDFSFETGFLRENYGSENFAYGDFFASGTYAYGLTRKATGALEAEISEEHFTAGSSILWLVLPNTKIRARFAYSAHNNLNTGSKTAVDFSHTSQLGSFAAGFEATSESFFRLGSQAQLNSGRFNAFLSARTRIGELGTLRAGVIYRESRNGDIQRIANASFRKRLGKAYLSLTASRDLAEVSSWSGLATLSFPLGRTTSHTLRGSFADNSERYSYGITYRPENNNYALNSTYNWGPDSRETANLSFNAFNSMAQFSLSTQYDGDHELPLFGQMSGAIGLLDDYTFAGRELEDSFLLVHVPSHPGIGVIAGGYAGETDENGYLLIKAPIPYTPITIKLDERDIPLGARPDKLQQTTVFGINSGKKVTFNIIYIKQGVVKIVMDKKPIKSFTQGYLNDSENASFSNSNGEFFVEDLNNGNNQLEIPLLNCIVNFEYDNNSKDPIPFLGVYDCQGDKTHD